MSGQFSRRYAKISNKNARTRGARSHRSGALAIRTALLVGLFFLLFLAVSPHWSATALVFTVDDSYSSDNPGLRQYTTIQKAINNASNGDTVIVNAGIYAESVVVNKSLTISGNPRNGTWIAPGIVSLPAGMVGSSFDIQANNVSISSLTFNISDHAIYIKSPFTRLSVDSVTFESNVMGVYVDGAANVSINNSYFGNQTYGIFSTSSYGTFAGNNTFAHNAIGAYFESTNASVVRDGNHTEDGIGVYLWSTMRAVVDRNHFGNFTGNGAMGVYQYGSSQTVVSSNRIDNFTDNGFGSGIYIDYSYDSLVKANDMSNVTHPIAVTPYGDTTAAFYNHSILSTNTVDGKPVYYYVNTTNVTVPAGAGWIGAFNVTGLTSPFQNISRGIYGIWLNSVANASFSGYNFSAPTPQHTGYAMYVYNSFNVTFLRVNVTGQTSVAYVESSTNVTVRDGNISVLPYYYYYAFSAYTSNGFSMINNSVNLQYYSLLSSQSSAFVRIIGNNLSQLGGGYQYYNDQPLFQDNIANDTNTFVYCYACSWGRVFNNTLTNSSSLIYLDGYNQSHFEWLIAPNNTWEGRVFRSFLNTTNLTIPGNLSWMLLANVTNASMSYFDPNNNSYTGAVIAYSTNISIRTSVMNGSSFGFMTNNARGLNISNLTMTSGSYAVYAWYSSDVNITNSTWTNMYYEGVAAYYSQRITVRNVTMNGSYAYTLFEDYFGDGMVLDNVTVTRTTSVAQLRYGTNYTINRANQSVQEVGSYNPYRGVYAYNVTRLTVTNSSFRDGENGVYFEYGSWHILLRNITIANMTGHGVYSPDPNLNVPADPASGNVTIDGGSIVGQAGYTNLQDAVHFQNLIAPIVIRNLNISLFWVGVFIDPTNNVTVQGNNISSTTEGIWFTSVVDSIIRLNTINGTTDSGIRIDSGSSNITVDSNTLRNPGTYGLFLSTATRLNVTNNTIQGSYDGIYIEGGRDDSFSFNTVNGTTDSGILVQTNHQNSTFTSNTVTNSQQFGFFINRVSYLTLTSNALSGSVYNFRIDFSTIAHFHHNIGTSNTVNSKPIYFLVNQTGGSVPTTAGVAILANCSGTLVNGLTVDHNWHGVLLFNSFGITVLSVTAGTTRYGVEIRNTVNSTIQDSTINDAEIGIQLVSSTNSTLTNNLVNSSSIYGVFLSGSNVFTLTSNRITNSSFLGLYISTCSGGTFVSNQMSNDSYSFYIFGSVLAQYNHSMPASNTINGVPIFYRLNATDVVVPTNVSAVVLANVTNGVVADLFLNRTFTTIDIFGSFNITVTNITVDMAGWGVHLRASNNVTVSRIFSRPNNYISNYMVDVETQSHNITVFDVNMFYGNGGLRVTGPNTANVSFTNATLGNRSLFRYAYQGVVVMNGVDNVTVSQVNFNYSYYHVYITASGALSRVSNVTVANSSFSRFANYYLAFADSGSGGPWVENTTLYHNNIQTGGATVSDPLGILRWYRAYPYGGNSWDNWSSPDVQSGALQSVAGADGIVDNPFSWTYTYDAYPLVDPWPPQVVLNRPNNNSVVAAGTILDFNVSRYYDAVSYAINNGSSSTFSAPFDINTTGWTDGTYHIWVNATDATGENPSRWFVVAIDSTAPAIAVVSPPAGSIYAPGTQLNFSITDAHLALNATWSNGSANVSFATAWNISTTGWADADYTITVVAWDTAGNRAQQSFSYGLDGAAPVITLVGPSNNSVVRAGTTIDLNIVDAHFANATWNNNSGSGAVALSAPFDIPTAGWTDGPVSVTVFANDTLGRQTMRQFNFVIDSTAPTITLVGPLNNSYIPAGRTLDFTVSDANLNTTLWSNGGAYSLLSSPWDISTTGWSDNTYTVRLNATDFAGNFLNMSFVFVVDSTPPAITFGSPGNNSYVPAGRTLDFTVSDPNLNTTVWSNGGAYTALSSPWDISTTGWSDGVYTVRINATDLAGNFRNTSFTVTVDSTPPSIAFTSPGNNAYVPAGRTLDFTVTETYLSSTVWSNGGAYSSLPSPWDISTAGWSDNVYTVRINATDLAGNFLNTTFTVTVDSTPPSIAFTSPGNNSYVQAGRTLDFTVTETYVGSTVWSNGGAYASLASPWDISTTGWSDSVYTIRINVTDLAGNFLNTTFTVTVDSTPPSIAFTSPGNNSYVAAGRTLDFTVTETYLGSTVWSNGGAYSSLPSPWDISTTTWSDNVYTVRINATDLAGNFLNTTFTVTVDSTPPSIAFTSPGNNSYVQAGRTLDFTVTETYLGSTVWSNGGAYASLASPWDIGTSSWLDNVYTVRINATDLAGNFLNMSFTVTVDSTSPAVTFPYPGAGSYVAAGTLLNFTVTEPNLNTVVWSNGGAYASLASPWDISTTGWADGSVTVRINATDLAGNFLNASFTFTMDSTAPVVVYNGPFGSMFWNGAIVLTAGTTLDFGVADTNLNATTWTNGSGSPSLATPFDVATTGWADGLYTVRVDSTDLAGNAASRSVAVIIDSTSPSWTFVSPGNNAFVVAGALLTFNLSELHPSGANWSNGGAPTAFGSQWNNATGIVTGTLYTVNTSGWADAVYTLTLSARDAAGNSVASLFTVTVDSTAPVISLVSPANNSVIPTGRLVYVDVIELNLASATWNNGSGNTNFTTPFNISTAGWPDGAYNVTVRATDRAGTLTVRVFHFVVDGLFPVIPVPSWNGSFVDAGTLLNITIVEGNPMWLNATLGAGSFSSNTATLQVTTAALADGLYTVDVTATDLAGQVTNASFVVTIDSVLPTIQGVTPTNGSFVKPGAPVSFSVIETNLLNVTFRRNGGAQLPANGTGPYTINTTGWGNANNTVQLFARDRAGHVATYTLVMVTDGLPPTLPTLPANQSYNEDVAVTFDARSASDGPNPLSNSSVEWNFSGRLSSLASGFVVVNTWDTPGNYTVMLTVTDAAGNANSALYAVHIQDTTAPIARAGADETDSEDVAIPLDGTASTDNDPDFAANMRFLWAQVSGPAVAFNPAAASSSFTPSQPGTYAFDLTVTDGAGLANTDRVVFTILDVTPPVLPTITFPVYNEGASVAFNASGTTDNDGANASLITYLWTFTDGSLVEIDGITGSHLFATPGLFNVNLTATDVSGNRASRLVAIRINDIPSLAALPPAEFELPGIYEVTLDILDVDAGDGHNITVVSPSNMTVVPIGTKQALRFSPGVFGVYPVNFSLSDGWSSVTFAFNLTITSSPSGNSPPVFTTEPVLEATSTRQYSYLAQATDPDHDRLIFGLDLFPAGMSINPSTGAVNWPHGYTVASGDHFDSVSLWVWDGAHFVYQNFTVRFLAGGNTAPVIGDGVIGNVNVKNGTTFDIGFGEFVTDSNDPVANLTFNVTVLNPAIAGATIEGTGAAAKIVVRGLQVGTTTVTLRVRDASGAIATKPVQVTVEPVVTAAPPSSDPFGGLLLPILLGAAAAAAGMFFIVMRRRKSDEKPAPQPKAPAAGVEVAAEVIQAPTTVVRAPASAVTLAAAAPAAAAVALAAAPEKKITYTIEGLFVIYKDGRLLYSKTDMGASKFEDPELVSSMFTAVQSFIKDSFQAEGELNKMGYGDNHVIIERGNHIFVAAIVYGDPDAEFTDTLRGAIEGMELSYAGVIEEWDGQMDRFSDMDQKLAPVAALTAGITRREVQLATTKQEVLMLSELEFFQGFVRLKVGIKNNTASVITKATVDIEYNEDVLRLGRVEPAAYRTSGAKVLLGVLNPGEKSSVAYYFDPQICTESQIDGVCRYRDATGVLHSVAMKTRKAEVVCPLFFTKEHANTAMLKRLVESELNEKDAKVFEIQKMPPYIKFKDVFDLVKSVVNAHDVQQVREFTKYNPFQGEAWFYGETKVKGYKMVIRTSVIEETNAIEFFAASTNMKAITGLLAEFNHTLSSMIIEKYSDLKIALTFDAEKKAEIDKKSLMSNMSSAELEGGETDQSGGGAPAPPGPGT